MFPTVPVCLSMMDASKMLRNSSIICPVNTEFMSFGADKTL